MVNEIKINGMLQNLRTALAELKLIANLNKVELLSNGAVLGGAKYYLQTAIESCINIGNHLISSEGYRMPKDYRDVFTILNEEGILPDDLTIKMRQMAGLRNRLVHLYWETDDEMIFNYLQNNLGDFQDFIEQIVRIIQQNRSSHDRPKSQ